MPRRGKQRRASVNVHFFSISTSCALSEYCSTFTHHRNRVTVTNLLQMQTQRQGCRIRRSAMQNTSSRPPCSPIAIALLLGNLNNLSTRRLVGWFDDQVNSLEPLTENQLIESEAAIGNSAPEMVNGQHLYRTFYSIGCCHARHCILPRPRTQQRKRKEREFNHQPFSR